MDEEIKTRSQIDGGVEATGGTNGQHVKARGMGLMVKFYKIVTKFSQNISEDLKLRYRMATMNNARHVDMFQLQTAERRLTEQRRQKQSLDSLLGNEKKPRKLAQEKAA